MLEQVVNSDEAEEHDFLVDGQRAQVIGMTYVTLKVGDGHYLRNNFAVIEGDQLMVLGRKFLKKCTCFKEHEDAGHTCIHLYKVPILCYHDYPL